MQSMDYKGYKIEAVPHQLGDSGEWSVDIYIRRCTGSDDRFRPFGAGKRCKTQHEAIQHCFAFGKQIIEGRAKGLRVDNL